MIVASDELSVNQRPHPGKVVLDRLGAALLLVVAAPVLALAAVVIRLDSPGPILYRRRVVGRNGVPFDAFKLRTMHMEAERRPATARAGDRHAKLREDPRVTRVGRWLRRTSVDELPQLVNVLMGQMSLVGPRIVTAEELRHYGDRCRKLLSVKPGMTGPWQVSGRGDLPYERRIELDMQYIDHWSIGRDLAILARTLPTVVRMRGAY